MTPACAARAARRSARARPRTSCPARRSARMPRPTRSPTWSARPPDSRPDGVPDIKATQRMRVAGTPSLEVPQPAQPATPVVPEPAVGRGAAAPLPRGAPRPPQPAPPVAPGPAVVRAPDRGPPRGAPGSPRAPAAPPPDAPAPPQQPPGPEVDPQPDPARETPIEP